MPKNAKGTTTAHKIAILLQRKQNFVSFEKENQQTKSTGIKSNREVAAELKDVAETRRPWGP
jgi:hypothetical protein